MNDCPTAPLIGRAAGHAALRRLSAPGLGADAGPASGVGTTRPWRAPQNATATEYPLPTEEDGEDAL